MLTKKVYDISTSEYDGDADKCYCHILDIPIGRDTEAIYINTVNIVLDVFYVYAWRTGNTFRFLISSDGTNVSVGNGYLNQGLKEDVIAYKKTDKNIELYVKAYMKDSIVYANIVSCSGSCYFEPVQYSGFVSKNDLTIVSFDNANKFKDSKVFNSNISDVNINSKNGKTAINNNLFNDATLVSSSIKNSYIFDDWIEDKEKDFEIELPMYSSSYYRTYYIHIFFRSSYRLVVATSTRILLDKNMIIDTETVSVKLSDDSTKEIECVKSTSFPYDVIQNNERLTLHFNAGAGYSRVLVKIDVCI